MVSTKNVFWVFFFCKLGLAWHMTVSHFCFHENRTVDDKPKRPTRKRQAPEDFLGKGPDRKIFMGKYVEKLMQGWDFKIKTGNEDSKRIICDDKCSSWLEAACFFCQWWVDSTVESESRQHGSLQVRQQVSWLVMLKINYSVKSTKRCLWHLRLHFLYSFISIHSAYGGLFQVFWTCDVFCLGSSCHH